jgi:hypothetical protein
MEMDFTKVKLNKEQQDNAFLIGSKAQEIGIDPDLALAFAWRENRFQTKGKSPKGATGVMQIMPANAKAYGYSVEDLQDPHHNIDVGLKIFKENLDMFGGNERAALVAYNANPNVAKRYLKNGETPESIPEETRIYLEDIDKVRPLVQRDEAVQEETQIQDDNFSPVEPLPEHLDAEPKTAEERSPIDKFVLPATGAGLGTALGFGEYMGNKPKAPTTGVPPTDPRFGTQTEFGTSGRAREAGFNLETQRRAEQAAKNKEVIERMRRLGIITQDSPVLKMGPLTATDTGLLVPPQSLEKEVKPLTRGQRFKEGLKALPRGIGEFIGKHSRITGPLAGLGAGYSAEQARERFEKGQIGGGLLSAAEALTAGTALTPAVPPPIRGIAGALSLPLMGAEYLYSKYGPQYESVTKRFPPKD